MATIVLDRNLAERLREERAVAGADRWDEVWEGTYVMTPLPNTEHQQIANRLATIFEEILGWSSEAVIMPGANISDRETGWEFNYRCPDVVVFLAVGTAKDYGTHWCGGPDFAVEIRSDDDQTLDKIPFYAKVGTRELLIIDRDPWQLELLRLDNGRLVSVGVSTEATKDVINSQVLPLAFRLVSGKSRPEIEVVHPANARTWRV